MQVSVRLRVLGHDVVTAMALGLQEADDDVHLSRAAGDVRILVTHNEQDFLLLHRAWRRWSRDWRVTERHAGLLVIPQAPYWTAADAADAIGALIALRVPMTNQYWYYDWRSTHRWQREPPP